MPTRQNENKKTVGETPPLPIQGKTNMVSKKGMTIIVTSPLTSKNRLRVKSSGLT